MVTSAYAQGTPPLPPNVPLPGVVSGPPTGVGVVAPPPANFNALTASPTANAQYSIPPAPPAAASPRLHAVWQKAMSAPATSARSSVAPTLTQTNISHGPNRKRGASVPAGETNNVLSSTSFNWSGTAVYNPADPFTVEAIIGEYTVPVAHQALGACTGGWDYSSLWPGIDGYGSGDVLQAGVEVDAFCWLGITASFYSAWIEWFPNSSVRVSSPVINPGDLIFVEVWNTSPTTGFAYFYNETTGETAEYSLTAPSGTRLVGSSVEWIVERPGVGGSLATLTNYIYSAWSDGLAWNYTAASPTYNYQGQNPTSGTLEVITMLDNNGNGISRPTIENFNFLWFRDFGSAY